jgi:glutamine synthetase
VADRCPQATSAAHQFLRNKRTEWREYRRHVTEFELGRYLPVL